MIVKNHNTSEQVKVTYVICGTLNTYQGRYSKWVKYLERIQKYEPKILSIERI